MVGLLGSDKPRIAGEIEVHTYWLRDVDRFFALDVDELLHEPKVGLGDHLIGPCGGTVKMRTDNNATVFNRAVRRAPSIARYLGVVVLRPNQPPFRAAVPDSISILKVSIRGVEARLAAGGSQPLSDGEAWLPEASDQ